MDPLILKTYAENSCFFIEQESPDFIWLSERSRSDQETDRKDFWMSIVDFIDSDLITITLSKIRFLYKHKGQLHPAIDSTEIPFICRLPSIECLNINSNEVTCLKAYIDIYTKHIEVALDTFEKYNCYFFDERLFDEKVLEGNDDIVNVAFYIPLVSISKVILPIYGP